MNAVGITAEYNPLHNGHIYNLNEAKHIAGTDAVVVAMSGNFVQRGEPAIFDKWTRARHAVENGADLVVEIPALFCLGNAGQYAKTSVALLEALGCVDSIAFGSESGDIDALKRVARNLSDNSNMLAEKISEYSIKGLSYPAAREAAYRDIFSESDKLDDDVTILSSSNDILAIEYIQACKKSELIAVRRCGAGYLSETDLNECYQSASAIRQEIRKWYERTDPGVSEKWYAKTANGAGDEFKYFVPDDVFSDIKDIYRELEGRWFDLVRYAVISATAAVIDDCPSGGEGLGNKLKQCIYKADNPEEFIHKVKSRRYTYGRISRLCAQLVLGINNSLYRDLQPEYIRVLAFNAKGRGLLADIKRTEKCELPIITNLARESGLLDRRATALMELDVRAGDIYNALVCADMYSGSDYRRRPSIIY